jgi:hypothetical protein
MKERTNHSVELLGISFVAVVLYFIVGSFLP